MYPKCKEIKCTWHLGYGYDRHPYLNGACTHSNGEDSMFCPLNTNSVLTKEKCNCNHKIKNIVKKDNRCMKCYGFIITCCKT